MGECDWPLIHARSMEERSHHPCAIQADAHRCLSGPCPLPPCGGYQDSVVMQKYRVGHVIGCTEDLFHLRRSRRCPSIKMICSHRGRKSFVLTLPVSSRKAFTTPEQEFLETPRPCGCILPTSFLAPSACWRAPLRHLATLCNESIGTRVFVQRAFGDGGETQDVAQ